MLPQNTTTITPELACLEWLDEKKDVAIERLNAERKEEEQQKASHKRIGEAFAIIQLLRDFFSTEASKDSAFALLWKKDETDTVEGCTSPGLKPISFVKVMKNPNQSVGVANHFLRIAADEASPGKAPRLSGYTQRETKKLANAQMAWRLVINEYLPAQLVPSSSACDVHYLDRVFLGWGSELWKKLNSHSSGDIRYRRQLDPEPDPLLDAWDEYESEIRKSVGNKINTVAVISRGRLEDIPRIKGLLESKVKVIVLGALFVMDKVSFVRCDDHLVGDALARLVFEKIKNRPSGKLHAIPCFFRGPEKESLSPTVVREKGFVEKIRALDLDNRVDISRAAKIKRTKEFQPDVWIANAEREITRIIKTVKGNEPIALVALSHEVTLAAITVRHKSQDSRLHVFGTDYNGHLIPGLLSKALNAVVGVDLARYVTEIVRVVNDWNPTDDNRIVLIPPHSLTCDQNKNLRFPDHEDVYSMLSCVTFDELSSPNGKKRS